MSELYHYGVKGMKWGVIRKRKKSPTQKPRSPQEEKDIALRNEASKHSISSLKASKRARAKYESGEDPTKDLNEARKLLKKAENLANKTNNPDEFLKSDWYLEPKWEYEDICDEICSDRGRSYVKKYTV